jgi:hypothetical protein
MPEEVHIADQPVKVEIAADPPAGAPITETVVEQHTTSKTTGDAAQASAVSMGPRFDDWVRALLAQEIVAGFLFIVIYGQVMGKSPDQNTLMVYVSFVSLSLGFYLGSSYGSNNKDKAKP